VDSYLLRPLSGVRHQMVPERFVGVSIGWLEDLLGAEIASEDVVIPNFLVEE
jgi:hypothetical protein